MIGGPCELEVHWSHLHLIQKRCLASESPLRHDEFVELGMSGQCLNMRSTGAIGTICSRRRSIPSVLIFQILVGLLFWG